MIKSLRIRNFQSHKDSEFVFDKGLNIVVGRSDSGKTAVVRALKWLNDNRPNGDSFRSYWGGKTEVSLVLDNEDTIKRIKDKGINRYILNDTKFDAFGTTVPAEITKALNLNEINLQTQFDKPFLLDSSPGEVAVHFNKIAHIDKIDVSIKSVQKWIREIEQKLTSNRFSLSKLQEEKENYDYLEKMEMEIEALEQVDQILSRENKNKKELRTAITKIEELQEIIEAESAILVFEEQVNSLLTLYEEKEKLEADYRVLDSSIAEINRVQIGIENAEDLVKLKTKVDTLLTSMEQLTTIKKERKELFFESIDVILTTRAEIGGWEIKEAELTRKFEKHMPDVCPLCNQEYQNYENIKI